MQNFIDNVAACKTGDGESVWNLLVDFARRRGFSHLVYGVKSPNGSQDTLAAYKSTHTEWLEVFVKEAQHNYCYISIKALTATHPFISGLGYLPEPWASKPAYVNVTKCAADHGLKHTLAVPLTLNSSPSGGSGVAFHTDLPKDQFEANVEKYQHELMTAALFANDWLKPWVAQNLNHVNNQPFTLRQGQVFEMLVQGLTNKEIAHRLQISAPTVSFHTKEIMMRIGAKNSRDIIRKAIALGLIPNS